jgi:hypothetical protein
MSSFSNAQPNITSDSTFEQHHVYEVATTLTDSKYIANDLSNSKRYAYRAKATLVGVASVRPYHPVYLNGLSNGMSGYWTVLAVKHIFGGMPMKYMMEVELGTDTLGDTDPLAGTRSEVRDVQAEISGQSLNIADTVLQDIPLTINATQLFEIAGIPTSSIVDPYNATPSNTSLGIYAETFPVPKTVSNTTKWTARAIE